MKQRVLSEQIPLGNLLGTRVSTVLVFLIMWAMFSCKEEPLETRSYPVIETNSVTDINENGAIFSAEILDLGTGGVIEHGFVYDVSPGPLLERSDLISLGETLQKCTYSILANRNLIKGKTYYVKAYAISGDNNIIVYGREVSFISQGGSAPKIEDFNPKQGAIGDTVVIKGASFSTRPSNNKVFFGSVEAPVIKSTPDSLWCIVPLFGVPGENQVSIELGQFSVLANFKYTLNPMILTSLIPNPFTFGDTLTIRGNNLPVKKDFLTVTLLNKKGLIYSMMPTELRVIVPNDVTINKSAFTIVAGLQTVSLPDDIMLFSPVINSFSPQVGTKGSEIIIVGNYFSPIMENNKVEINGVVCTVTEASKKSIKIIVPSGIVPGEYPISITIANQNKISTENFEVIQPSITNISPLHGTWGTIITITGENFGPSIPDNIVKFNNVEATVVSASSTALQVKVPNNLLTMSSVVTVKVSSVDNLSDTFGTPFDLDPPTITSFSPGSGKSGSQVTIQGQNFNPIVNNQVVRFGSQEAHVLSATSNQLVVQLPKSLEDSDVNIEINVAGQAAVSGSTFHLISPWKRLSSFPGTARDNAVAFAIDGQGYLGLGSEPATFTKRIWKYDPSTDMWSDHVTFNFPSIGAGAPFLNMIAFTDNTNAFVGLGTLGTSLNSRMRSYDPTLNSWVSVSPIGNIESQYSTDGAVAYGINGKGYVTTGQESGNSLSFKMWEYDPGTDLWSRKVDFPGSSRMEASGFSIGDKAYLVSGRGYPSYVLHNDLWAYDVTLNNWNQLTSLPGPARWQSTAFSINGMGYLLGGGATNIDIYYNLLNDAWMYNPISNSWSQLEDFPGKPRAGATVFVIGNKAYFGTGRSNPGGLLNDFWEFDPSKL